MGGKEGGREGSEGVKKEWKGGRERGREGSMGGTHKESKRRELECREGWECKE